MEAKGECHLLFVPVRASALGTLARAVPGVRGQDVDFGAGMRRRGTRAEPAAGRAATCGDPVRPVG